jgi:uncharacterized protein (TIGR00297 family)
VIAIVFALVARFMGAVTDGGAIAGVLVAFVLMLAAGFAGFLPLLALFLLTVLSTRWGYARKQRLGVAERRRGRRASQVIANLGAAAVCALPAIWFQELSPVLLAGSMAALAEAAADTVSGELGQATARGAYMITDFRDAPIGRIQIAFGDARGSDGAGAAGRAAAQRSGRTWPRCVGRRLMGAAGL